MDKLLEALRLRLQEISDLEAAGALLYWDQCTYMPRGGAKARARQTATLARLAHQRWVDSGLGELLEKLKPMEERLPYESLEASLIRVASTDHKRALRIPPEFMETLNSHVSQCYEAWRTAKSVNDFSMVRPFLERTVELSRRMADFFSGWEHPADPLIDLADPGETVSRLRPMFSKLRDELVNLLMEIRKRPPVEDSCLKGVFPDEKQLEFTLELLHAMGYDLERGRQDLSAHPFMIRLAGGDVRITTRVHTGYLAESIFGSIHEAGHALYEQGIPEELEGTPLAQGASAGIHESQSRLWENMVARSLPFWKFFYPRLQKKFPQFLEKVDLESFFRAIHKVEPGCIRTQADEVTYNLHVIIRFELELELLEGSLAVKDLPELWEEKYQTQLGVKPSDDREGVLQDMHWFSGTVGGAFQCYTLGNLAAAQMFQAALEHDPQIPSRMEQGDMSSLLNWLRQHVHCHGRKFKPTELLKMATGSTLRVEPYLDYLRKTYGGVYGFS
ncbi:MAG: carboxypeptidase M32 [bacterium]